MMQPYLRCQINDKGSFDVFYINEGRTSIILSDLDPITAERLCSAEMRTTAKSVRIQTSKEHLKDRLLELRDAYPDIFEIVVRKEFLEKEEESDADTDGENYDHG